MAASSTQYATPMGRGAYDTTGVPKPPPPKPSVSAINTAALPDHGGPSPSCHSPTSTLAYFALLQQGSPPFDHQVNH
ncbi:hypothetical protein GGTG_04636 [Gaeumannomyces tritici R3-111a-1]|uniref:Uncharacterized protein n=1 Tax=Gaeumannomyces tritici (strain R3-111a-1) TaxID=644352 RepID=J3NTN6_GAET3|nr:hypothetical protein GGTG_04636 [Gaeumannomyces tritici R3-111a-1]EJT79551.1 hypothetical protein GGTG_04636 [Gaeumannomyces tritici R3-111a-1]